MKQLRIRVEQKMQPRWKKSKVHGVIVHATKVSWLEVLRAADDTLSEGRWLLRLRIGLGLRIKQNSLNTRTETIRKGEMKKYGGGGK